MALAVLSSVMVRQSHLCRSCSSLYHHGATVSYMSAGCASIFTTMVRPPHQRRPCRNPYHHVASASSSSSVCRYTNMLLTASLTSHMWESITLVATVPLKLSHVKYNHSNNRLINVVRAEYIRIITKFTVWLPHLHRRCTTLFLIKEFVYQKEQRHALSIV